MCSRLSARLGLSRRGADEEEIRRQHAQAASLRCAEAACCEQIFAMFQRGALILDEVDLILHPLKSELNWPLGRRVPIDFSTAPQPLGNGMRWRVPMHLMDALLACDERSGGRSIAQLHDSAISGRILTALKDAVRDGLARKQLQLRPHLVLLDHDMYTATLQPLLARWAMVWISQLMPGPL